MMVIFLWSPFFLKMKYSILVWKSLPRTGGAMFIEIVIAVDNFLSLDAQIFHSEIRSNVKISLRFGDLIHPNASEKWAKCAQILGEIYRVSEDWKRGWRNSVIYLVKLVQFLLYFPTSNVDASTLLKNPLLRHWFISFGIKLISSLCSETFLAQEQTQKKSLRKTRDSGIFLHSC